MEGDDQQDRSRGKLTIERTKSQLKQKKLGRGDGGQVVSVRVFFSNRLSSKPA